MTNGIDGYILCAMNANEIILIFIAVLSFLVFRIYSAAVSMKSNQNRQSHLNRIKKASLIFRVLNGIGFLLIVYCVPAILLGWPPPYPGTFSIVISENHIYTSFADMPQEVLALWLVKMGLLMACMAVFDRLFRLYGKGILFSARNITYIRFQGYYLILDWVVYYQMQGELHDMVLNTAQPYIGFLIIFIAWIMDEGRKIQEEQELTV